MKYSAISIGPIYKTIKMARKPKELWAASYLFSLLMKCIIEQVQKDRIISPTVDNNLRKDVGLYPDRVFFEGEIEKSCIERAILSYADITGLKNATIEGYFNIMYVAVEATSVSEAIRSLNNKLDCLELFERAIEPKYEQEVLELLKNNNSKLFLEAHDEHSHSISTMSDIACNNRKKNEDNNSYNSYFCVVQADGDNMGKIIAAENTDISKVSSALLAFGNKAVDAINKFAETSLPIYTGGDDLLFVVPVVGNNGENIIDLLGKLDELYDMVKKVADTADAKTSMSYGVAICYHKYPLYEAFNTANTQLFRTAKEMKGKNAMAIDLRKHSGGAFSIKLSKGNAKLSIAFNDIIRNSTESEAVVSAVSHKVRNNDGLLNLWVGDSNYQERNANFFEKYMEYNSTDNNSYKAAALNLLNALFAAVPSDMEDDSAKIEWVVKNMYGMLRIAKFMKGEERHD